MVTAFTAAVDALFANPNLGVDVIYRAGGETPATMIRANIRQPDRVGTFGETRIAAATLVIDVRASEVAAPAEDETIEMDGTVYVIQGERARADALLGETRNAVLHRATLAAAAMRARRGEIALI